MKILVIARLKPSQIKYKIQPLLNSHLVDEIIVLRKYDGPKIEKLNYIILPKLFKYRLFYVLLTPLFSIYYAKKLKVDLILSYHFVPHGFNAFLTHVATGIPFIYGQIDMDIERFCENSAVRSFIKYIMKNSKYILVLGNRSKNFWIKLGFPENKIWIMPSSIDTHNQFYPLEKKNLFDLLFIGTLDDNKQILSIMKAVAQLVMEGDKIKFAIAGFGPLENRIKSFIRENKLEQHIIFLGEIHDVLEIMNSSRFFIMASEHEGLPCALMEAMACGKIVITTPAGDIPDIVQDERTGFIIDNTNSSILANRIKSIMKNFDDYSIISNNARNIIVEEHSFKSTTLKWNKLLSKFKNENFN
jgi:colanic acid/amylovoran biosynthesis glycosyltransferase